MNETIIVAPAKSPIRKMLRERLSCATTKRSFSEIEEKHNYADRLRRSLIQETVTREGTKVEHARKVARATKDKRQAAAVALSHQLAAKQVEAEERRKARSPLASPSSSLSASPLGVTPSNSPADAPFNSPADAPPMIRLPISAAEPTDAPFRLPPSVAEEAEVEMEELPTQEQLRRELGAAVREPLLLIEWMKQPSTVALVAQWLGEHGVQGTPWEARKMLGLVYMAHDTAEVLGGDEADADDTIMAGEAARFKRALKRQLRRGAAEAAEGEPFAKSYERACRFHQAWARKDVPKMEAKADEVLHDLARRVMAVRAQQSATNAPAEPPEVLLAQIRALGGEAAEAEVRERFERPWEAAGGGVGGGSVGGAGAGAGGDHGGDAAALGALEARVRATAQRALFDAVGEQVRKGEYDALWSLLDEVQRAMLALVAHDARQSEALADRFDAAWLRQRAEAGALETADVHQLMNFVVETVSGWQAPVDDDAAREWAAATARLIDEAAQQRMELAPFIATHLLPFLAATIERVGQVYKRMIELGEQLEATRAAA